MAYIYKISNDINDKVYIGKTLDSVEKRWKEHLKDFKKNKCEKRPLYSAMKKYGSEHFKVEQIEICSDNEVSEREIYWIEYFSSYKNGYNATKGGDGKPYINKEVILLLWNCGLSVCEINNCTGYANKTITKSLISCSVNENFIKERKRLKKINTAKLNSNSLSMIDKDSKDVLKVFNSTREACEYLEIDISKGNHIRQACKGLRKSAYGYEWSFN